MNELEFPMRYESLLCALYGCQRQEKVGVDAFYANDYLQARGYTKGVALGKVCAFLLTGLDCYKDQNPGIANQIDSFVTRLNDLRTKDALIQFVSDCLEYVNRQE